MNLNSTALEQLVLYEEKVQAVASWVASHGTEDQRARHAEGLFPDDQAIVRPRVVALAEIYLDLTRDTFDPEELARGLAANGDMLGWTCDEARPIFAALRLARLLRLADQVRPRPSAPTLVAAEEATARTADLLCASQMCDSARYVSTLLAYEPTLVADPAGTYARMDDASQDLYRHAVERLAWRTQRSADAVAVGARDLASAAAKEASACDTLASHIGYYLIDDGRGLGGPAACRERVVGRLRDARGGTARTDVPDVRGRRHVRAWRSGCVDVRHPHAAADRRDRGRGRDGVACVRRGGTRDRTGHAAGPSASCHASRSTGRWRPMPARSSACPRFCSTPRRSVRCSRSCSGNAAQLIAMKGPRDRGDSWWMNRAMISLPVPDSP